MELGVNHVLLGFTKIHPVRTQMFQPNSGGTVQSVNQGRQPIAQAVGNA